MQWFNVGTIYYAIGTQSVDKSQIASILSLWTFLNTFALSNQPATASIPSLSHLTRPCCYYASTVNR